MRTIVPAIGVAIVLNRRLAAFRAAKAEFEQVIERFNIAAARAEAGVNALKLTGEVTGGPKSYSPRDRSAFLSTLDQTIRRIQRQRAQQPAPNQD